MHSIQTNPTVYKFKICTWKSSSSQKLIFSGFSIQYYQYTIESISSPMTDDASTPATPIPKTNNLINIQWFSVYYCHVLIYWHAHNIHICSFKHFQRISNHTKLLCTHRLCRFNGFCYACGLVLNKMKINNSEYICDKKKYSKFIKLLSLLVIAKTLFICPFEKIVKVLHALPLKTSYWSSRPRKMIRTHLAFIWMRRCQLQNKAFIVRSNHNFNVNI